MTGKEVSTPPAMPDSVKIYVDHGSDGEGKANTLVGAVVDHINDDIKNAQTLRDWRPCMAKWMIIIAATFYVAFFVFCFIIMNNERLLGVPSVCIAFGLLLSLIPTMLLLTVARAVFGNHKGSETPFSPMQALLNLMKEVKGS